MPTPRLHVLADCYKIKLRTAGWLVYQVHDQRVVATVIAVGKRDKGMVYMSAEKRV